MGVPQYTTPTFTLTFTDEQLDLTQATSVYVTFKGGVNVFTKSGESLTVAAKQIDVRLTQQETAKLNVGEVEIQANWVMPSGDRAASEIAKCTIDRQLLTAVIE